MALNCSHRPVFPAHISENTFNWNLNGYLVEGVAEKNGEGYASPWHENQGETEGWYFDYMRDNIDQWTSLDNSKDIVDLLPSDPFEMDIETTFTAITGWFEDLEVDYGGYVQSNNGPNQDYDSFAEWNFIWNNALKFQPFPDNIQFNEKPDVGIQSFPSNYWVLEKPYMGIHSFPTTVQFNEKLNVATQVNQCGEERYMGGALGPCDFGFQSACNKRGIMGFNNESSSSSSELQFGEQVEGAAKSEGMPHEAWFYVLSFLGVKDLLSAERVCRSLYSAVRGDLWLWESIHIDQPLNEKITDDFLFRLACRARGDLQCLSLVECPKITDYGVRHILETNPRLTKLFVPGCTRITIEGILRNIKIHNSKKDFPGIKHLRIGGFFGVTREHYEELKLLLGVDDHKLKSSHKPHFYHRGNFYLPFDDDRAIDIEICPRCEKLRLVYDCPARRCLDREASQACRGCTLCIPRCAKCGRCIDDNEYEETFCLDLLCSDCFQQLR